MILSSNSPEAKAIDASLDQWRQGDLVLGEQLFVHVGDRSRALSVAASELGEDGLQAVLSVVEGFAMVSQTCDIVRKCVERPYVEVSPLVAVDADALLLIQRGGRPSLATLPALAAKAELARIGRYYATESMLVWDAASSRYSADATPATGSDTLFDFYASLASGASGASAPERGDHAVF